MGAPGFEAALLKNGGVLYMRIASPDAHVTEIDVKSLPPWLLNYHLEAYSRSAERAQVPIQVAIAKAEKRNHAPAIDAGIAKPLSGGNAVLANFVETLNGSRRAARCFAAAVRREIRLIISRSGCAVGGRSHPQEP